MDLVTIILIFGYLLGAFIGLGVRSASVSSRIYNGYKTSIYNFPYQLSLHSDGDFICGAEIIGEHYALTAAHCVYGKYQHLFTIRSGSSFKSAGGKVHKISSDDIHIHEKYSNYFNDYDVAVIHVEEALFSKDSVARPISLPNSSYVLRPDAVAIVTGWGACASCPIARPEQFNAVELPVTPWLGCKHFYPYKITERMICTGYATNQKGPSKGDSGGPLVVDGVLIGTVSWGNYPFPMAENPAVYANVIVLSDWIRAKIYEIESKRMN